jgi:hypothetical protein
VLHKKRRLILLLPHAHSLAFLSRRLELLKHQPQRLELRDTTHEVQAQGVQLLHQIKQA